MIKVVELCKQFQRGGELVDAVKQVSFEVKQGEVYGLLGPNGAGKTTTMRMILGLLAADSGYAEVEGFRSDTAADEVKRRVGFVSASAGIYQWLTGREMLTFFADVYGLPPAISSQRIDELSQLLNFEEFLNQRCATLSTGQKQRLNLARALIHDPQVMILDEPTLGLDIVGSQAIFEYIELLKGRQKSIILCTHQLEQAQRVCDRFGLLFRSRLILEGTMAEIAAATGQDDLVKLFVQLIRQQDTPLNVPSLVPALGTP